MAEPHVDFLGEIYPLRPDVPLVIGRDADLIIDDNPYLHRRFLEVVLRDSLVWITNLGSSLTATLSDAGGLLQAWLAPGAKLPLVFERVAVWFTAGPTTYEFDVLTGRDVYSPTAAMSQDVGQTTVGRVAFTPDQKLLILVLAEDLLRRGRRGTGKVPSNAQAATALGWTQTKFNRKLDNVCEKLTKLGVQGLHGGAEKLATNRRARLVEYALAARLITAEDMPLLEGLRTSAEPLKRR
jgi:hypothetical protein